MTVAGRHVPGLIISTTLQHNLESPAIYKCKHYLLSTLQLAISYIFVFTSDTFTFLLAYCLATKALLQIVSQPPCSCLAS